MPFLLWMWTLTSGITWPHSKVYVCIAFMVLAYLLPCNWNCSPKVQGIFVLQGSGAGVCEGAGGCLHPHGGAAGAQPAAAAGRSVGSGWAACIEHDLSTSLLQAASTAFMSRPENDFLRNLPSVTCCGKRCYWHCHCYIHQCIRQVTDSAAASPDCTKFHRLAGCRACSSRTTQ
jgi:hypothetical protein